MAVDAPFIEAFKLVGEMHAKLRNAWNDLTGAVNYVLGQLPGFLGGPIRSAYDALAQKVSEALDKVAHFYQNPGDPSGVRTAGEEWTFQVGAKASNQAGLVAKEKLNGYKGWTGEAGDGYSAAITLQGKALAQLKTMTDALQSTLNEIASAISTFWVGFGIAICSYVAAMVSCIVGAATVVGAPAALATALVATGAFITAVFTLTNNWTNTLNEKKGKLEQQATVGAPFTNGTWPLSTSHSAAKHGADGAWSPS